MKRCPTCNRTFTDKNLSFCIDDGTPLTPVPDDESTVVSPSSQTSGSGAPSSPSPGSNWSTPAYKPPRSYVPPGSTKTRTWPWILGALGFVLLVVIGLGVALAVMVPRMLRASANRNRPPATVNLGNRNDQDANRNSAENANASDNANANTNENANTKSDENLNPPPTDSSKVLSDLTDLENEWTAANINADKKALDRILADDFVGTFEGQQQVKKQYLREIQRDSSIDKWHFQDLKVNLNGDRATLTGIVKYTVRGTEQRYSFVDKFAWREGRWQATSSDVNSIK